MTCITVILFNHQPVVNAWV